MFVLLMLCAHQLIKKNQVTLAVRLQYYLCFSNVSLNWLFTGFRDGVSESQFNQVLNIELDQIIEVL